MKRSTTESGPRSGAHLGAAWKYQPQPGFHDEMLTADGEVRAQWQPLIATLNALGPDGLHERWQEGRRLIHDNGVTYNVYGDPNSAARPWPLDPIPFVIASAEWTVIEAAIVQRATLLNRVLADSLRPAEAAA